MTEKENLNQKTPITDPTKEELVRHNPELEYVEKWCCDSGYVYYIHKQNGIPSLKRAQCDGKDIITLYHGQKESYQSGWYRHERYWLYIAHITDGYVFFIEGYSMENDYSTFDSTCWYKIKTDGSGNAILLKKKEERSDPDGERCDEYDYTEDKES